MRRNSVNTAFGLKTDFTILFSDHDFLKMAKILVMW